MGRSSPWCLRAPVNPTPTGAQIIKYAGDKWVINMREEKAGLKWRPAGGEGGQAGARPGSPSPAAVYLAKPPPATGAVGGAGSAERAATQPRKQRAAAAEGRARPPGSERGGAARCWRRALAARAAPASSRVPARAPPPTERGRREGSSRGRVGIRRCFSQPRATQSLMVAGRSATTPLVPRAPPSPSKIVQAWGGGKWHGGVRRHSGFPHLLPFTLRN